MLQNSTILITGGGSGIGEALAMELSVNNKVVVCGRNEERLKRVASKSEHISYEVVDVADYNSIEKLFTCFKEKQLVFNVLINNAGVVEIWDLTKNSLSSKEIFEKSNTNFSGAVAITQQFIIQANPAVENVIVNNTSEIVLIPVPLLPLYSASKAGLSVFTKALRVQLKHTKFKVIELLTPATDTDMPKKLNNKGRLVSPAKFAINAIASIRKGNTTYAPGNTVFLFKLFQKLAPNAGLNLVDKLSRKQLAR
jgi:uncharacterized oxidoreductase